MIKKIYIAFCLLLYAAHLQAQNKYNDSLTGLLELTTDPLERFTLLQKMQSAILKTAQGNVDSLICIQLHEIALELHNDSLLAISYNWIGDYFLSEKGDNIRALEYLFKGIPLAEKVKDREGLSSLYLDISVVYFNLNNPDEAIRYIRKAGDNLPPVSAPGYDHMAQQYESSMANYFILQHQTDSALHFIQRLNETNLRLKSKVAQSKAWALSAALYDQTGDTTLAEHYYSKANALADSGTYYDAKYFVKKKYAQFLLLKGRTDEAGKQAAQLYELGTITNNNDIKITAAGILKKVYASRHNTDSAYFYSRMESSLKDSVFSQDNINKIQALAFNEQLRIIDERAELAAEAEKRNKTLQFSLLAAGILTFIILILLLSRSMITSTRVIELLGAMALLIVFEFINLLIHPVLEEITHHSPLFMLMILVCIAALLLPIHRRLEKMAIKKLVEKNKAIRLAEAKRTIEKLEAENN